MFTQKYKAAQLFFKLIIINDYRVGNQH